MFMSHCQNAGQNLNIEIAGRSFESVVKFEYLGTTAVHQNFIREESNIKLNFVMLSTVQFTYFYLLTSA
jgi:hypothetical protein